MDGCVQSALPIPHVTTGGSHVDVDLRQLAQRARRWWWLIVAIPAALAVLAFVYTSRQDQLYLAEVSLEVKTSANDNAYDALLGSERQAKTYQRLVTNNDVLTAAAARVDPPVTADVLAEMIQSRVEPDTSLLLIGVSDTDPARAAVIANIVADELVKLVDARNTAEVAERTSQLQANIDSLQDEIDRDRKRITTLENAADAGTQSNLAKIADINDKITRNQNSIELYRTQIGATIINQGDSVKIFSPAIAPTAPYAPRLTLNLMLAILMGLMIAAGVILVLDYLDNTVKSSLDFPGLAGGPLLATVRAVDKMKPGRSQLFMLDEPKGMAAESIRLLRTNIEFASATREMTSFSLTSPNSGEGKSTIAANLAIALAQAGFATMLIDADFRRPTQHRIFGTANDRGLSMLLAFPENDWSVAAQPTMVPNLSLIPAGPLPPNPADLLSLDRMQSLVAELGGQVDVVLIDSPPVLAVSDPLIVASQVDGTLLVTLAGKTRVDALRKAAQVLQRGTPRMVGVVINQQTGTNDDSYYYQEYGAVAEPGSVFRRRPRKQTAPQGSAAD